MNFKKALRKEYTYEDKTCKNHDYTIKCILEITNDNIHAAGNYYGKKEYYKVIKCSKCNSFVPNSEEGDYSGHFFNRFLQFTSFTSHLAFCPFGHFFSFFVEKAKKRLLIHIFGRLFLHFSYYMDRLRHKWRILRNFELSIFLIKG